MKTRTTIALAALGLANATCTGAEAPPPRAGFWIQMQDDDTSGSSCGLDGSTRTLPKGNARIGEIDRFATQELIDGLELIRDGSGGASVSCMMTELGIGSYDIRLAIGQSNYLFDLSATTANGMATNGSAGYRSPETASETIRSAGLCQVTTFQVPEGGGSGIIEYTCNNAFNPKTPQKVCRLYGAVYVRDCDK